MPEPKPLICIVDDRADYRSILQVLFDRYLPVYAVAFFAGGQALLEHLPTRSSLPGLIILDQHMPGLTGYQTLQCLRAEPAYQRVPIVIMSADISGTETNACYSAGVDAVIRKPLDFHEQLELFNQLCQEWIAHP